MNKQVGNTTIQKRIQKHVQPSRCPEEFMKRRKSKYSRKAVSKKGYWTVDLERQSVGPLSVRWNGSEVEWQRWRTNFDAAASIIFSRIPCNTFLHSSTCGRRFCAS